MHKKSVKIVAVKFGSKGCYVTDGKQSHHVEAFKCALGVWKIVLLKS